MSALRASDRAGCASALGLATFESGSGRGLIRERWSASPRASQFRRDTVLQGLGAAVRALREVDREGHCALRASAENLPALWRESLLRASPRISRPTAVPAVPT